MPKRIVSLINNHSYHVFNRGVEKRIIFQNTDDYHTFLEILSYYLTPDLKRPPVFSRKPKVKIPESISLLCYCLMPNHFHLLIQQKKDNGIFALLHALSTTYSLYFNRKYKRVGSLFQGRFKAERIDSDESLLYLSKYIHLNPRDIYKKPLKDYPYSSYQFYLKPEDAPEFLKTNAILPFFSGKYEHINYRGFVEEIDLGFPKKINDCLIDYMSKPGIDNFDIFYFKYPKGSWAPPLLRISK